MANELNGQVAPAYIAGPIYAIIRNSLAQPWNTGTNVFETYNPAHITSYAIVMTDEDSSGYYVANFPTITTAGIYSYQVYYQIGGDPSTGDTVAGVGVVDWNGTSTNPAGNEIILKSLLFTNANDNYYFTIQNRNQIYNWNTQAFETYLEGNFTYYAINLNPLGVGQNYFANSFPTSITVAGVYAISIYQQENLFPSVTDTQINQGYYNWPGYSIGPANNYTTLNNLKIYLGISDTDSDTTLLNIITQASQAIANSLKRNPQLAFYVEPTDGSGYSFVRTNNYPITYLYGITNNSQQYDGSDFIWNSEGTIRWKPQGASQFTQGFQNYVIEYQAGYNIIPSDLQLATQMFCQFLWTYSQLNPNQDLVKAKDVTIQQGRAMLGDFSDKLFNPIEAILKRYRQIDVL